MCRWLAYSGSPIALETVLLQPEHSLIDQSLRARMGVETTNGDGFGVGWYGDGPVPGLYRSVTPAWNDRNLRELAAHVRSGLFLAHIRAATVGGIQRSNCHPFSYEKWLFVHNGSIDGYEKIHRDLAFAVAPELFNEIAGTTDSELMFLLALTFGMASDVASGIARMAGFVEEVGRKHGIEHPLQMSLGISDGENLYAVRYSSIGQSRSLFHSRDTDALQDVTPEADRVSSRTVAVVSEPLTGLAGRTPSDSTAELLTVASGAVVR